jgi:two-component system sensor histidine kinase CpxA
MRRLFLKIFLAFWIVQLISVGFVILRARQMARNSGDQLFFRESEVLQGVLLSNSEHIIDAFERHDTAEMKSRIQQLEKHFGFSVFLFDSSGHEIQGIQPPESVNKFLQHNRGKRRASQTDENTALELDSFVSQSGQIYTGVGQAHIGHSPIGRGPGGSWLPRFPPWRFRPTDWSFLAASGLIAFFLSYALTRPIVRLRTAAQRLASGDLSARAPDIGGLGKSDEVANLTHDFNIMAERIEHLVSAQRTLISDISHELRSPLARLSVALGLARQRTPAEAHEWLDRIENEEIKLNALISQLLDLSRFESDLASKKGDSIDLAEIAHNVVEDANFEASLRNCRVVLRADTRAYRVRGKEKLLQSALENVVRNALRYTAEGTDIEIVLEEELHQGKRWHRLTVSDSGPGLPEEELEKVFRPFYRSDGARTRETGGVGLGLAIARRAIEAHGGTIVASNRDTSGLCVEICLPAAPYNTPTFPVVGVPAGTTA